jgi:hypothetical protein
MRDLLSLLNSIIRRSARKNAKENEVIYGVRSKLASPQFLQENQKV